MKQGQNIIDGVVVTLVRKKVKRISLRVKPGGETILTVPLWRATIAEGEAFLRSKWHWVLRARERALSRQRPPERVFSPEEISTLISTLEELHALWAAKLGQSGTTWKLRRMKTRWGVCNWAKRHITYAVMLAGKSRELVEYVVVHEFTHFDVHGHGPRFRALMDIRLPDWKARKKLLNSPHAAPPKASRG